MRRYHFDRSDNRGTVRLLFGLALTALAPGLSPAAGGDGAEVPVPSVARVLAACARGAAAHGRGLDAAMCEWYTAPCGCKPGQVDSAVYRWCLPPDEPIAATSRTVIAELRRAPNPTDAIDRVLPPILARLYPCTGRAGH